jgi:rhodanese-related sulfurtransferase
MKKLSFLYLVLFLVPLFLFTACDKTDDPIDTPEFTLLKDYLVDHELDLDHVLKNLNNEKFVVAAPATEDLVDDFLTSFYIMDIRSSTDFANGHVKYAKNVPFTDILTDAVNATKPILVICYTGQTACYATSLLRLYGFEDTQALKWGMSGWNSTLAGPWNNNIGNIAENSSNWSNAAPPANIVFEDPEFTSTFTDGEKLLQERIEAVVAEGFKGVNGADVLANPTNYFINNYFSETDYLAFGHINNAYRINPLLLSDNSYKGLDPGINAKVITYCYTGQTSALVTAYLRVLGYDAYSLKFGMNGMFNSNPSWTANKWSDSVPKDFPLFTN